MLSITGCRSSGQQYRLEVECIKSQDFIIAVYEQKPLEVTDYMSVAEKASLKPEERSNASNI